MTTRGPALFCACCSRTMRCRKFAAKPAQTLKRCKNRWSLSRDVLVKDWVMPGVSNLEITQEIARRLPATAIVLFSFHDLPEMEIIAKAAGVHGVASKSLSSVNTSDREGIEFFGESTICSW